MKLLYPFNPPDDHETANNQRNPQLVERGYNWITNSHRENAAALVRGYRRSGYNVAVRGNPVYVVDWTVYEAPEDVAIFIRKKPRARRAA